MVATHFKKATTLGEALVWYHFIPASGPDGNEWYRAYRDSGCEALAQKVDISVSLMRRRQIEAGMAMLDECRVALDAPGVRSYSRQVVGVAEEAYFGALAYYHYHCGEYAAARDALSVAAERIVEVVTEAPFLATFTVKCYDFALHRARIARGERRWSEMWRNIDEGREMVTGLRPLCYTRHGALFIGEAEAFLRTARVTDDIEREALYRLRDRSLITANFEKRALGATMLPGIVIDY
jgi:hypothetical protein